MQQSGTKIQMHACDADDMQVTELFTGYVGALLAEHAQNPTANWKAKDCAIYLVVALTVRGRTAAQGATTTNQLVNIGDFYSQQVCSFGLIPIFGADRGKPSLYFICESAKYYKSDSAFVLA